MDTITFLFWWNIFNRSWRILWWYITGLVRYLTSLELLKMTIVLIFFHVIFIWVVQFVNFIGIIFCILFISIRKFVWCVLRYFWMPRSYFWLKLYDGFNFRINISTTNNVFFSSYFMAATYSWNNCFSKVFRGQSNKLQAISHFNAVQKLIYIQDIQIQFI